MKLAKRLLRPQKGQSLIELAFGLVILLVIVTGTIELGRLMFQYVAMRDAAQEGAVFNSLYPTACNQTTERIRNSLYSADRSAINVDILVNGVSCSQATSADACSSKEVVVKVEQPDYRIAVPFLGAIIGTQSINLNTTVRATIIRPPCP